jgi:hypothetical protein
MDGGATDGGATDGGATDGGATDGGATDGGAMDGGGIDAGGPDAGELDGGAGDAGSDGGTTCVPASCPTLACGWFDAGCGVSVRCGCAAGLECGVAQAGRCGLPRLCDAEGWCFENPLPQGNTIFAGWSANPLHTWWVGANATVLHWNGERHTRAALPSVPDDVDFRAVHGRSDSDVLVVGTLGTIYAFDGMTWMREPIQGGYTTPLTSVFALPGGGAVAGGPQSNLYRRNLVGVWEANYVFNALVDISDVSVGPDGLAWAVGVRRTLTPHGVVLRERTAGNNTWDVAGVLPMLEGRSLWLAPDGGFFAAGRSDGGSTPDPGVIARRQPNGTWVQVGTAPAALTVLRGRTADDYFAAGENGVVVHVVDGGVTAVSAGLGWNALGFDDQGALVEGTFGEVARFHEADGGLELRSSGARTPITSLCGESPGDLFAGSTGVAGCTGLGCAVTVLSRSADAGPRWQASSVPLTDSSTTTACAARDGARFVAGDHSSVYLSLGGVSWLVDPRMSGVPPTSAAGLWVPSSLDWWVTHATAPASGLPFVTHFTGTSSNPTATAVSYDGGGLLLTAMGGPRGSGWAVGQGGLRFVVMADGGLEPREPLGTRDLLFVASAELADGGAPLFTGGRQGALYRQVDDGGFAYDGPLPGDLIAGLVTATGEFVAVGVEAVDGGPRGRVLRRDATGWWSVPFRGDGPVRAAWATTSDAGVTTWVGGTGGRIWRKDP